MSATPVTGVSNDSWPSLFAHPRNFSRESENESYLAYLDDIHRDDYDSDSGSESPDNEGGRHGEGNSGEENSTVKDELNATTTSFAYDLVIESLSPVRRFNMTTVSEEAEYSVPLGGDDAIADFVEHAMSSRFQGSNRDVFSDDLVGLIDVETKTSVNTASGRNCRPGKPFRGGRTRGQLRAELAKPVSVRMFEDVVLIHSL